jgi:hypothetical protein
LFQGWVDDIHGAIERAEELAGIALLIDRITAGKSLRCPSSGSGSQ